MRRLCLAVLALTLIGVLPTLAAGAAGAATFPAGFTDTGVASVATPTAIAQLPDGTILVTSKTGQVTAVNPATGAKTQILDLTGAICTASEQGSNGIAVDPNFTTNRFIYVAYTSNKNGSCDGGVNNPNVGAVNRVSRFTYGAGGLVVSGNPIIDNIPSYGQNHDGGYLYVGNDNKLYLSTGDGGGGNHVNGQDPNSLNGKILRMNLDGTPPSDNPFAGDSNPVRKLTFAWGLRNPFRLAFKADDPGVKFRINDVGEGKWEEIDDAVAGANYGWYVREGPCAFNSTTDCGPPPPTMTNPVAWYGRTVGSCITGGAYVPDGAWSGYNGAYLFADYCAGKIFVQKAGQTGADFGVLSSNPGSVTDMRFVQEGGRWVLYYIAGTGAAGELRRLTGPPVTPKPPPPVPSTTAKFVPVAPTRILDTRIGLGSTGSPVMGQTAITLPIAGKGIVPAGASAVALNVTGANSASDGFVTVWPSGQARPTASTLNFSQPNDVAANEAVVPLGADGAVQLFTQYNADLIADITGYWVPADASTDGRFAAVDPTRIVDTRTGLGAPAGKVPTGGQIDVQVTGAGGVPATGVSAVALTVTFDAADGPGFVTVYPTGTTRPVVSNLNPTAAGDIRANLVIVPVGADGKLSLYTISPVHLIVDVAGWFSDASAASSGSGLLKTVTPTRLLDTRDADAPFGRLGATQSGTSAVSDVVTGSAQAVFQNLTMTGTAGAGFVTAYPNGTGLPLASNVNATAPAQNRAALALTRLGPGGVTYYAGANATDLVVDISAWVTP